MNRYNHVKRICVIGGGNIGMALTVEISQNSRAEIVLLTSKAGIFEPELSGIDAENKLLKCRPVLITSDYAEALDNVDLIFITFPAFLTKKVIRNLSPHRGGKRRIIVLVPGSGGREFYFRDFAVKGDIVIGFDRAPFVSRISKPGSTTHFSKKDKTRFSSLNKIDSAAMENMLSNLLNMRCTCISHYLNITFTPSNQILHTARLYTLFAKNRLSDFFSGQIKFYAEWDDDSSDCLLAADDELQSICGALAEQIDLSGVIPLKIHYESDTSHKLTEKIRSIKSLSGIDAPLVPKEDGYVIDRDSRYFQEDFPFGLCIIKDFAVMTNTNTPVIDRILQWYAHFFDKKYFINGVFSGADLTDLALPRNFGIASVSDIRRFYQENFIPEGV